MTLNKMPKKQTERKRYFSPLILKHIHAGIHL